MGSSDDEDYQHEEEELDLRGLVELKVTQSDLDSTPSQSDAKSSSAHTDPAHNDAANQEGEEEEEAEAQPLTDQRSRTLQERSKVELPAGQSSPATQKAKRTRKRRKSKRQINADNFFSQIDAEFLGRTNITDDVFVYAATDVLIQKSLEVPVLAQWPNAAFEYEFSADPPNVKFAIAFMTALSPGQTEDDLEIESVFQRQIVDTSDPQTSILVAAHIFGKEVEELELEQQQQQALSATADTDLGESVTGEGEPARPAVKGAFSVDREGTVLFVFDVNDDWWLSGLLVQDLRISYKITAHVPSFSTVDEERSLAAEIMMRENDEELNESLCAFNDCEAMVSNNLEAIALLEGEISALEAQIKSSQERRRQAEEEELSNLRTLKNGYERMNGLCIRTLNKHLLSYVLGYLMPKEGADSVPKSTAGTGAGEEASEYDGNLHVENNRGCSLSAVGLVGKYWHQCFMSGVKFGAIVAAEPFVQYSNTSPDLLGKRLQRAEQVAFIRSQAALKKASTAEAVRGAGGDHVSNVLAEAVEKEAASHAKPPKRGARLGAAARTVYASNSTAQNMEIALSKGPLLGAAEALTPKSKAKSSSRSELVAVGGGGGGGGGGSGAENEGETGEDEIPITVKKSQDPSSPQNQMDMSTLALLSAQMDHLTLLRRHKKSTKGTIKRWTSQFEEENARLPSTEEKRDIMGAYYSEYSRAGKQLKTHTDKLMQTLEECGMTVDDLEGM